MKDTSYKNKQFVLLGMTFLSVAGIAGCSKEAKMERHWKKAEKYYS